MSKTPSECLDQIEKALLYAEQCLDGVVSMDYEDEGEDGGSATCQACVKIVRRAQSSTSIVRAELDTLRTRVAELEAGLHKIAWSRPLGPSRSKAVEKLERIALDALEAGHVG